jgi:Ca2+-binding RTX toxin-like protein
MGGKRIAVIASVLGLALLVGAVSASGKTITGSKRADKLAGTSRPDKIKGRGGNDKLKGKGGNDKLAGGKGRDRVNGGRGRDRIGGGPGNDTLLASDGVADRAINGGGGSNLCILDIPIDLPVAHGCTTIQAGSGSSGGGGGGGGGGGANQLRIETAQNLVCLPLAGCAFLISGEGADSLLGDVTGGGSVTSVLNVAVNVVTGTWVATGTYTCSATGGPGYLVVTIGTKSTPQIPVSCG